MLMNSNMENNQFHLYLIWKRGIYATRLLKKNFQHEFQEK
jgi:hypothetical protein